MLIYLLRCKYYIIFYAFDDSSTLSGYKSTVMGLLYVRRLAYRALPTCSHTKQLRTPYTAVRLCR